MALPRVVAAHAACCAHVIGPGWVAVGDAAGSHDPLSASGIVRRQCVITFDPNTMLRRARTSVVPFPTELAPLTPALLLDLCGLPRLAHPIVAAVRTAILVDDITIILGLQWLLQRGK